MLLMAGHQWTFARLNTLLGANALSWFEAVPGFLRDGSNVLIADGASPTYWYDRRDPTGGGSVNRGVATGAGLIWNSAGKSVTFDGTNYLNLSTPIAVADPVSGSPSTWYVATGARGSIGSGTTDFAISPVGGTNPQNIIVQDDSGNGANNCAPYVGGLIRVRRLAGDQIVIDATGAAIDFDGIGSPFTFDTIGQYRAGGTPTVDPAGAVVRAILVIGANAIAAGLDDSIRSYLQSTFGVSL